MTDDSEKDRLSKPSPFETTGNKETELGQREGWKKGESSDDGRCN